MNRRLKREGKTLKVMVQMFCESHHDPSDGKACPECASLLEYAAERLRRCPFGADKPVCGKCPVHCYKPEMRARIVPVMRYSGPKLMTRHPYLALMHLLDKTRPVPVKKGKTKG